MNQRTIAQAQKALQEAQERLARAERDAQEVQVALELAQTGGKLNYQQALLLDRYWTDEFETVYQVELLNKIEDEPAIYLARLSDFNPVAAAFWVEKAATVEGISISETGNIKIMHSSHDVGQIVELAEEYVQYYFDKYSIVSPYTNEG